MYEKKQNDSGSFSLSLDGVNAFINERPQLMWLIILPDRPGTRLAVCAIEYLMYPPGTPANDSFELLQIPWEGLEWIVAGFPIRDKVRADALLMACGLRAVQGFPSMLLNGKVSHFPVKNSRCFNVENRPDGPALFSSPDRQSDVAPAEFTLCERVWAGWSPSPRQLSEAFREAVAQSAAPPRPRP